MNLYALRYIFIILLMASPFSFCAAVPPDDPHHFGIYVSTLDGKNFKQIISDSSREINHARVSPDKQWITFSRFNVKGRDGKAKEIGGSYEETEIMLIRLDGTELTSLVPSKKGEVAVNSYWSPDGESIIYFSTENTLDQSIRKRIKGEINRINIVSRNIQKLTQDVPLPEKLRSYRFGIVDPHHVKNNIAVSVPRIDNAIAGIWIMNSDGTSARQLTRPKSIINYKDSLGDTDPKISPDGSQVAFMRHMGKDIWHIVVVDVATGIEKNLSHESRKADAMPEWSSDGKLLLFWHVDLKSLKQSGLYTMRPDGSDRRRIPLPRGYFYTMPAFFPGEGSGSDARIIFSAEKNPSL